MEIRVAANQDIPEIVELLKVSLGESLMPKSEGYWRWKHLQNPFGNSPVLLAVDAGQIVGVRAFMRWQWKLDGLIYNAVRAVDTATHPKYQGKGIFKKLTLSLVKECSDNGDAFVFNTPNQKSKVGYLKMGWQSAGRLPVRIAVRRPFSILTSLTSPLTPTENIVEASELKYFLDHPDLDRLIQQSQRGNRLITNVSSHYLRWRYADVPVAEYTAIGLERNQRLNAMVLGRIKSTRMGREFRITDHFMGGPFDGKDLMASFKLKMKSLEIDYVTMSGTTQSIARKFRIFGAINLPIGPEVTIRSLRDRDLSKLQNFRSWSPSLGDLELF